MTVQMKEINLKKNILVSGSFRLIVMFISFFVSWISARYLGVELKGKYSYLLTISGFIWLILDLGVYRSYPYFVRKYPLRLQQLFSLSAFSYVVETLFLVILGLLLIKPLSTLIGFQFSAPYMFLWVLTITFTKFNMQLSGLYLGMDKVFDHSMSNFGSTLLFLLLLLTGLIVFNWPDRLVWVMSVMLCSNLFSLIYYLRRTQWNVRFLFPDKDFLKLVYTYGFRVFLSSLFILFLMRFDIILIKRMLNFSEVGIYSVAANIIEVLQIASNVVGGLLLVKLSDSDSLEQKWHIMRRMVLLFLIILGVANLAFVLVGRFILAAFYGIAFVPVYEVYLWLIPASFFLSFGSLFNNYLNSKGFPIISIILPAIALLANIIMNLIFIPIWGINGAAMATSVAYAWWFLSIIIYEHRSSGGKMLGYLVFKKADLLELRDYARSKFLHRSSNQ